MFIKASSLEELYRKLTALVVDSIASLPRFDPLLQISPPLSHLLHSFTIQCSFASMNLFLYRIPSRSPFSCDSETGSTGQITASQFGSKKNGTETRIPDVLCSTRCWVDVYNPPVHSASISPRLARKQPCQTSVLVRQPTVGMLLTSCGSAGTHSPDFPRT